MECKTCGNTNLKKIEDTTDLACLNCGQIVRIDGTQISKIMNDNPETSIVRKKKPVTILEAFRNHCETFKSNDASEIEYIKDQLGYLEKLLKEDAYDISGLTCPTSIISRMFPKIDSYSYDEWLNLEGCAQRTTFEDCATCWKTLVNVKIDSEGKVYKSEEDN